MPARVSCFLVTSEGIAVQYLIDCALDQLVHAMQLQEGAAWMILRRIYSCHAPTD